MASARLRQITRRYEKQRQELRHTIGAFLVEFASFESVSLTEVLKALSSDDVLVEHLPELMDLYQRLKLMKQLGVARRLPAPLKEDIGHVRKMAHALLECRNDIAHGHATLSGVGTPICPRSGSGPKSRCGCRSRRANWRESSNGRGLARTGRASR
jgi:hypothetical protein